MSSRACRRCSTTDRDWESVLLDYFWIVAAALGGFAIAWPIAYAWAGALALKLAGKIIEREYERAEDAQKALAELHRQHVEDTERRRKR